MLHHDPSVPSEQPDRIHHLAVSTSSSSGQRNSPTMCPALRGMGLLHGLVASDLWLCEAPLEAVFIMPRGLSESVPQRCEAVARRRGAGVTLAQFAKDFGISESCLISWLHAAEVELGAGDHLPAVRAAA